MNEFALQIQDARHANNGKPNGRYQQVLILAGLHVLSRDF